MQGPVNYDENVEARLTKNIMHCLVNSPAEIAVAALVKVLQSLIIGISHDKGEAMKHIAKVGVHLRKEVNRQPASMFGSFYQANSNEPIIAEEKKGG